MSLVHLLFHVSQEIGVFLKLMSCGIARHPTFLTFTNATLNEIRFYMYACTEMLSKLAFLFLDTIYFLPFLEASNNVSDCQMW